MNDKEFKIIVIEYYKSAEKKDYAAALILNNQIYKEIFEGYLKLCGIQRQIRNLNNSCLENEILEADRLISEKKDRLKKLQKNGMYLKALSLNKSEEEKS